MKTLNFHPYSLVFYLLTIIVLTTFCGNPLISCIALLCGFAFLLSSGFCGLGKILLWTIPIILILTIINPFLVSKGGTPLLFVNGKAITLESICYGVYSGIMIVSLILWCKIWSEMMTADKLLTVLGGKMPKIALILISSLRFLPLFRKKYSEIKEAQMCIGYKTKKGIVGEISSVMRIFSTLTDWALENTIITGLSMSARGYGLKGKKSFSPYLFRKKDGILIVFSALFLIFVIILLSKNILQFSFYPHLTMNKSIWAIIGYCSFSLLAILPSIINLYEVILWKSLERKI